MKRRRSLTKKGRSHQLQRGILGTGDADLSGQSAVASNNDDFFGQNSTPDQLDAKTPANRSIMIHIIDNVEKAAQTHDLLQHNIFACRFYSPKAKRRKPVILMVPPSSLAQESTY